MCQLCAIKDLAARDRWPNALEQYKSDIDFLVTSAHDEYTSTIAQQPKSSITAATSPTTPSSRVKTSSALLDLLRTLVALLSQIEKDREEWWTSPAKREQRRNLELKCNQKKLSELHKINNKVVEGLEGMEARVGGFVRWGLGMNGGVGELQAMEKEGGKGGGTEKSAIVVD